MSDCPSPPPDLRWHRANQPSAVRCRPGGFHCRRIFRATSPQSGWSPLMPLHLRGVHAEQQRNLLVGRGLGRLERVFDPPTLLSPLLLLQIVDGHLPAFRRAENENTEMLLCGVVSPPGIPSHHSRSALAFPAEHATGIPPPGS